MLRRRAEKNEHWLDCVFHIQVFRCFLYIDVFYIHPMHLTRAFRLWAMHHDIKERKVWRKCQIAEEKKQTWFGTLEMLDISLFSLIFSERNKKKKQRNHTIKIQLETKTVCTRPSIFYSLNVRIWINKRKKIFRSSSVFHSALKIHSTVNENLFWLILFKVHLFDFKIRCLPLPSTGLIF